MQTYKIAGLVVNQLKLIDSESIEEDDERDELYNFIEFFSINDNAYNCPKDRITANLKTLYFNTYFEIKRTITTPDGGAYEVPLIIVGSNLDEEVDKKEE